MRISDWSSDVCSSDLEDILEEIVGEFTTDLAATSPDIHPQEDGTYVIDGSAHLRDINRTLDWTLPTGGPRTLNGLILEHLQDIPDASVSMRIDGYLIEILHDKDNMVKAAKEIGKGTSRDRVGKNRS